MGTVICDLDGVVYLGEHPVPGSAAALARIAADGHELLFCTNNSSLTRADVAERIRGTVGFPVEADQVVSSAEAAVSLVDASSPAFVLGGPGIDEALARAGVPKTEEWTGAGSVIVGIDRAITYERLADAVSAVRAGARLVATNDDPTYPTRGRLLPGAGVMVAAVERGAETRAEVAGKPHPAMRALLRDRIGPRPVWVVGDRVDTDITMAVAEGWIPVLVLSGVTGPEEASRTSAIVVPSLADVPALLG